MALEPSLGRHDVLMVIRWDLYFSAFSYTTKHMPGELNTMADIISRWMCGWHSLTSAIQCVIRLRMVTGESMVPSTPDSQAEWPSRVEIRKVQRIAGKRNGDFQSDDDELLRIEGKMWIPQDADDMKIKFLSVTYTGQAGHSGSEESSVSLDEELKLKDMAV